LALALFFLVAYHYEWPQLVRAGRSIGYERPIRYGRHYG
jgi:hypothetical protein